KVVVRWPFSVLGEWWVCLAIDQIAQTGLSSLPLIYYLEQLFRRIQLEEGISTSVDSLDEEHT
ncbi:hypothetical protein, partial [Shewanella xiamenensis]|uniref:hypothetical protein n=1 Tax=Shewanella xiamenensis TaxID=332186 RepID=UPI001A9F4F4A